MSTKILTVIAGSDIDTFYDVESFPRAGDACVAKEAGSKVGGCVLNVGTIASYLGMNVKVLETLKSEDPGTGLLLKSMNASGMDTSHIRYGKDVVNGRCLIMRCGSEKCIFVIPPERPLFEPDDKEICEVLGSSAYLYSLAHTLKESFADLRTVYEAQKNGALLILDGSSQYNDSDEAEITRHCDALFINTQSYARLSGCYGKDAAEELLQNGTQFLCVTDGSKGSTCITKNGKHFESSVRLRKVVDSTGAGDTFAASFITSLSQGSTLEEAHKRASYAGALACLHEGAISPQLNAATLDEFIRNIG